MLWLGSAEYLSCSSSSSSTTWNYTWLPWLLTRFYYMRVEATFWISIWISLFFDRRAGNMVLAIRRWANRMSLRPTLAGYGEKPAISISLIWFSAVRGRSEALVRLVQIGTDAVCGWWLKCRGFPTLQMQWKFTDQIRDYEVLRRDTE